ncbi:MAG: hypothetical protein ACFE0Q_13120 [Anaerolineae bacterium]
MSDDFIVGKQRRTIEDQIVERFEQVNFKQKQHAYLEDDAFWDFVFSWYELVKYYERVRDTAIGAHMLELYQQCRQVFHVAVTDSTLHERRRDKASDAIYQMTYYVDRMLKQAERNGIEKASEKRDAVGDTSWTGKPDTDADDSADDTRSSMN